MAGEINIANQDGSGSTAVGVDDSVNGFAGAVDGSTVVAAPVHHLIDLPTGQRIGQIDIPEGFPTALGISVFRVGEPAVNGVSGIYGGNGQLVGFVDASFAHIEIGLPVDINSSALASGDALLSDMTAGLIGQSALAFDNAYSGLMTLPNFGALTWWANNYGIPYELGKTSNPGGPDGAGASDF